MQTLSFSQWELSELVSIYHDLRNTRQEIGVCSAIMRNRTERLFDKLRFAEFAERNNK